MRTVKNRAAVFITMLGIVTQASLGPEVNAAVDLTDLKDWKEIPRTRSLGEGAFYSMVKLACGTQVHVVVFDLKSNWRLRPVVGATTAPVPEFLSGSCGVAAINGGYFNLSDGESASYIVLAGKVVCDPRKNNALISNPKLKEFLPTIFSERSELRLLKDRSGTMSMSISPHGSPIPGEVTLTDSLQAGPQLLPVLRCCEEAFLRKQSDGQIADSIGCRKPAARSAIGLTGDNKVLLVAVAGKGQNPESSGLNLEELSLLLKSLGATSAINLDGGASTTLAIKPSGGCAQLVCGKNPLTRVKSVLVLEKVP